MSRFLTFALFVFAVAVLRAEDKPREVPISKLGTEFRLVGDLHEPLGTVVTVQGVVVDGQAKGYKGGPNIRVQRINGRATQEHIQIKLFPFGPGPDLPKLEFDATYELKGYETGAFVGIAPEVNKILANKTGNLIGLQAPSFHLTTYFEFLEAEKIKPVRWSPADFADRMALLEGRAVSENKKAYIVGDGWRLLVDAGAPWSKEFAGKTVEGLGRIRKMDERNTYQIEKGVTRLVRLDDQIGRKVTLRGTAWSMSGNWWFEYRGVDLYVEKMKDLPSWLVELHGESVQIEGTLEEEVLPDVRQLHWKEKPDGKKQFIVRKPTWKRLDALLSPELGR